MNAEPDQMQSLPDDIAALRALVMATMAERDAAITERNVLQQQNDRLRHLLLKLQRMQFGAKSERLPEEQLQLGLEALEEARPRLRSRIPTCARTARPSVGRAAARCRAICHGSR